MPEHASANGRTRVAFGDVVRLSRERSADPVADGYERYVGLEHIDPTDLRIRRWGRVAAGTTFTKVFRRGQTLFGKRRAYQRKVAVAEFDGVCSGDIYVLAPKDTELLPELLPSICQSEDFFQHAVGTSAGSLSPRTNWESLAAYEFALPPIEEQRAIAGLLAATRETTEGLRRLLQAASLTEAALFDDLLAQSKASSVELGALLTEAPRNGHSAHAVSHETGHWVLALSAITPMGYRPGELKPVERTPAMAAATLRRGELIVSRSNTRELVGLPAIFDEARTDVSWPDTMTRLVPDEKRILKRFLELFLRSRRGRQEIQSRAAGTSASMKKINGEALSKLSVQCPTLEAQEDIERATESVRKARRAAEKRMRDLAGLHERLLNAVLHVNEASE